MAGYVSGSQNLPRFFKHCSGGPRSLFGGPLSTRNACVNHQALERQRQLEEAEFAKRQRLAQKSGLPKPREPRSAPPPDPKVLKKQTLKKDLADFDDLTEDGPGPAKPKARKSPSPEPTTALAAERHGTAKSVPTSQGKHRGASPVQIGNAAKQFKPGLANGPSQGRAAPSISAPGGNQKLHVNKVSPEWHAFYCFGR